MESRADRFYQYILLYRQFINSHFLPVFGLFNRNRRNIISSFTLKEFEELTVTIIRCNEEIGENNRNLIEIDEIHGCDIPGSFWINEHSRQAIPFSEECDPFLVDPIDRRICLVANLLYESFDKEGKRNKDEDYSYGYEVCSIDETKKEYPQRYRADSLNNYLATQCNHFDRGHDFKTPFILPPKAMLYNSYLDEGIQIPLINYNWQIATGIGLISGNNNNNCFFRCIDIDGCDCEDFIDSLLRKLDLPYNYEWVIKTGSGEGYHIWVDCEDLPEYLLLNGEAQRIYDEFGVLHFLPRNTYKNTFKALEIRWNAFCMLPPSISSSGGEYTFRNSLPRHNILKIPSHVLFDSINLISVNSAINCNDIISHNGFWSNNEEVETIFMCFDTETTGLPKDYNKPYSDTDNWPHIVQLSYILFSIINDNIKILTEQNFILCPDETYSIPSNMIHGISNEIAIGKGYNRKDVLNYISRQLEFVDYLVGHNVDFDINVIRCEFEREKIEVSEQFDYIQKICTMRAASTLYPKGTPWPKLEKLFKDLKGQHLLNAHNAYTDVHATIECFEELLKRNLIKVNTTIRLGDTFSKW